jgi:uncharacterized protein DUF742
VPTPDDPRGHLVRPYAFTAGSPQPSVQLAIETLLRATRAGLREAAGTGRDRQLIIELCSSQVQSLAEIAAHLGRPLDVAQVLIAELIERGLLDIEDTGYATGGDISVALLERVLSGLHKL